MNRHELRKLAFSRMVEGERVRYEQRHGRGNGASPLSEARRRLEARGAKVTSESLDSEMEYQREQGEQPEDER